MAVATHSNSSKHSSSPLLYIPDLTPPPLHLTSPRNRARNTRAIPHPIADSTYLQPAATEPELLLQLGKAAPPAPGLSSPSSCTAPHAALAKSIQHDTQKGRHSGLQETPKHDFPDPAVSPFLSRESFPRDLPFHQITSRPTATGKCVLTDSLT